MDDVPAVHGAEDPGRLPVEAGIAAACDLQRIADDVLANPDVAAGSDQCRYRVEAGERAERGGLTAQQCPREPAQAERGSAGITDDDPRTVSVGRADEPQQVVFQCACCVQSALSSILL